MGSWIQKKKTASQRVLTAELLEGRRLLAQTPVELVSENLLSIGELTEFQNALYFSARGRETADSSLSGSELWKVDAQGNLDLVKDIAEGPTNGMPRELTPLGSQLFFTAQNPESGLELWKTDGSRNGTVLVDDIAAGPVGSNVAQLTPLGSEVFFVADDGTRGAELWKSNGSGGGTSIVSELVEGAGDAAIMDLTAVGSLLFFSAVDPSDGGRELWSSDGTSNGTTQLTNLGTSNPESLFGWNGSLYFVATTPQQGRELWTSDGTAEGTQIVADIYEGVNSGFDFGPEFVSTSDRLYFAAKSSEHGLEPFFIDQSNSVSLLMDVNPGGVDSSPDFDGALGDYVLFSSGGNGTVTHYLAGGNIDGATTVETQLEVALDEVVYVGDAGLVFTSGDAYWQTDNRLDNTELIAEPNRGVGASNLLGSDLIFHNGNRLFTFPINFGAPAVEVNDLAIDEGEAATFLATSPDGVVSYTWDINNDGVFGDATGPLPTLTWQQLSELGLADDGDYLVTARAETADGKTGQGTATLTVSNVAPFVDVLNVPLFARVDNSVSFVAAGRDPGGSSDPITLEWDFGDGSTASGSSVTHSFSTAGSFNVSLTVMDDDGGVTLHEQVVLVQVSAPNAIAGGPYRIDEGSDISFDASSSSDPNGAVLTFEWDFNGDGVFDNSAESQPALTWSELSSFGIDNDGTHSVRVRVSDPNGIASEAVATIIVDNVPPEIVDLAIVESQPRAARYVLTATATDVNDELLHTWDFGDGSPLQSGAEVEHVFALPGTYTVTVTVDDGDGGVATRAQAVVVEEVVPAPSAGGPYEIVEGGAFTLDASGSVDPNGDPLTAAWDLNNDGVFGDATGLTPTVSWDQLASLNSPANDDGSYDIQVEITDSEGNSATATAALSVINAPPTVVALTVPTIANPGNEIAFAVSAEDFAGANDPLSFVWDFGDGSSEAVGQEVTHTFDEAGIFTVTVTTRDDDGGETTETGVIRISAGSTPPNISTGGPYTITEGESLTLDATETVDPLGRSLLFLWDINDDGVTDVSTFDTATLSWDELIGFQDTLADDGIVAINLLVASLGESDVVTAQTTLMVLNAPPVIESVDLPTEIVAGRELVFSSAATDINPNDSLIYTWDFGDGTSATGSTITKEFAASGTYAMSLTVDDGDGGVVVETFTVEVAEPAALTTEDEITIQSDSLATHFVNLLANDEGTEGGVLQVTSVNGLTEQEVMGELGTLTWAADGSVSYVLNNELTSVMDLPSREVLLDEFVYTAADDTGEATSRLVVTVSGAIDVVPPAVVSLSREDTTRYDFINSYTVAFSEDVSASLEAGHLLIVNAATNEAVDTSNASVVWTPETNTATWDLSGVELPQGRYVFSVSPDVQDAEGNQLEVNAEVASREEILSWQGDANLDLTVDFADFLIVSSGFGVGADWFAGDFDSTNSVDFPDFLVVAVNFGSES